MSRGHTAPASSRVRYRRYALEKERKKEERKERKKEGGTAGDHFCGG